MASITLRNSGEPSDDGRDVQVWVSSNELRNDGYRILAVLAPASMKTASSVLWRPMPPPYDT